MPKATLLSATPRRTIGHRQLHLSRRALFAGMPVTALAVGAALLIERRQRPPAAAAPISLEVISAPPGATVLVDGRKDGRTPVQLALSPGTHIITLAQLGAIPADVPVQIYPGRPLRLSIALWRRQPAILSLRPPFPGSAITSADFLADGRVTVGITLPPGNVNQLWSRDQAGRLTQLGPAQAAGLLAASPDGRTVAYLAPPASQPAQTSGEQWLTSVWTGPTGGASALTYALPATTATARLQTFSWAPDGHHLLLVRSDLISGSTRSLLLWLDLTDGTSQRLVDLPSAIVPGSFLWSPRGQQVAFLTRADTLVSLCLLTVSPPSFRYLTDVSPNDSNPLPYPPLAWSPDGVQVVYAAPVPAEAHGLGDLLFGQHSASALFRTVAASTQSARLGTALGSLPTWRPDGSVLALLPASSTASSQWETVDPATGQVQSHGPVILPVRGVSAVRWDRAHRQALLVERRSDGLAFWLLSFAPEVQ